MLIITFSQTQYTRRVAEHMRVGAIENGADCERVSIRDVDTAGLHRYDLVGLGTPVFYYQEPANVRQFIADLPDLAGKHWFIFTTHASTIGVTMDSMRQGLENKGAVIVGYHDTYADSTMPVIPYPTLTTGHPDESEYEEARLFGKEIVSTSQRIAAGDTSLIPTLDHDPEKWAPMAEALKLENLTRFLPRLRIDTDLCTQCRTCEENCPVDGIDATAAPPVLQTPCIYCWRCVMVCPEIAIDAVDGDWGDLLKNMPQSYKVYRERLDEAAARGEFKWLMDPDTLDFENTQLEQRRARLKEQKARAAEKKG
jgi:Fe-S-cluster-containing hydrogenase component 2/flavodoxin